MPLLKMTLSVLLSDSTRGSLLADASKLASEVLGKPERYVMVTIEQAPVLFGGDDSPAAFIEVRSLGGLSPDTNRTLSAKLSELIEGTAKIPKDRTFLNFFDLERSDWGHNGTTF